jgi:adenine-specific DNA-methyltransferase
MNSKYNKLELCWPGKDIEVKPEPRVLIENPDKSYGEADTENMLIHADNLLALKALEQKFTGKIKCIYIDPPYNTGNAFEHYDDGLEHSIWLNLLKDRISLLHKLLKKDGVLFISIDDDEVHYLKILCDEIFGRTNYLGSIIWEKKKKPSFLSNMGSITEYILCFGKSKLNAPPFIYGTTTLGKKYPFNNAGNGIAVLTFPPNSVHFRIKDCTIPPQDMSGGNIVTKLLDKLLIVNGKNKNEFRLEGEWRYSQKKLNEIILNNETIVISQIPFRPNHVKQGGEPKKMKNLLSIAHYEMSTYEDASKESVDLFGQDSFDYPKPEKLLSTLISSVTNEGDIVLDSFLGSGTTAAVATKLGLRWIGIELGDHCNTHCLPRLKQVCDGTDQGGISKAHEWKGGGGFKYYELAPSMLNKDKYNQWVINPNYNAQLLAAAMAKQEGFIYNPSETIVWKQGSASENHFIYTTTNTITRDVVEQILSEMKPDESLRICCVAFVEGCNTIDARIEIKKIPEVLLGKCEFDKEDYSTDMNIVNMPLDPDRPAFVPSYIQPESKPTTAQIKKNDPLQTNLLF